MNSDIYKATNYKGTYLFIPSGVKISTALPEGVIRKLGNLEYFKSISFDENSPLIAADPKEVIRNIEEQGFHIQGPVIKTKAEEVSEAGAAIGGGILAASIGLGPVGALVGALAGYLLANASKEGGQK
ncbi:MAG: YcgL domain-containing protein [Candidatus Thiodiazotropha taylori]|nr:YcgL domain-containing protein [Candidatus Thiodiazotropha taylori]